MRIAFVYFADFDAKAAADEAASEHTGVELVPSQAPSVIQVPVACKKAFAESSADCVVAFVQADPGQSGELDLLHEKTVDVELAEKKFVFTALLLDDEWNSEEERHELALKRVNEALEKAAAFASHSPSTPEMPDWMPGGGEQEEESGASEDDLGFMDEVGHKLF